MAELGTRVLMPWDAEWLFKMTGDPEATRYMGFKTHQSVDEAQELLHTYAVSDTKFLAIVPVDKPGELLGIIGYEIKDHHAAMLIQLNLRDRRVRGAGRKVCTPFVYGLLNAGLWRVWAYVHTDNIASQRVMERSGANVEGLMRRYATFPNISETEPQDCFLYAITR